MRLIGIHVTSTQGIESLGKQRAEFHEILGISVGELCWFGGMQVGVAAHYIAASSEREESEGYQDLELYERLRGMVVVV